MIAYRATLRIALLDDSGKALEQKLASEALAPHGFDPKPGHGATWERFPATTGDMAGAMRTLWAILADYEGPARIAHVNSRFEEVEIDISRFTGKGGTNPLVAEMDALGLEIEAKLV